jgi:hypothetical protein
VCNHISSKVPEDEAQFHQNQDKFHHKLKYKTIKLKSSMHGNIGENIFLKNRRGKGVGDVARFHYPSMKPSLKFSSNFAVYF